MTLVDRTVLVTAASSGIGLATATRLRKAGAAVFIAGRDEQRTRAAAETVGASGWIARDLAIRDSAREIADAAAETLGRVDILVSNTGGPRPGDFLGTAMEEWDHAYGLILRSALQLTHTVLPEMLNAGWGRLIYLTSSGVTSPLPGLHLSNVLRAGVENLARSLVPEVGPRGVTTHVVAPAHVDTDRYRSIMRGRADAFGEDYQEFLARHRDNLPLRRLGASDDVAALVEFLCSDDGSYLTGQRYLVDGGTTGTAT